MDSTARRCLLLALLLTCLNSWTQARAVSTDPSEFNEAEIQKRIAQMDNEVVQPRYDVVVRSYLKTYTVNHRDKAERILGRRILYFPLFEDYLRQNNMPTDLKFLPIVESALEPRAVSPVGATGLWQFMAPTARYFGLRIDSNVDERRDPYRSTEAAIKYLSELFDKFGNWELAIAAYNSGSGRVSRAVKRSRSTNFWKLRGYLPSETRNYVPAFIAASYLVKHFEDHELEPEYPDLDLQLTETISIYQDITFEQVSQITGISVEVIQQLNPAFSKPSVPASTEGYYFTLPRRVIDKFRAFLESERPDFEKKQALIAAPVLINKPREAYSPDYVKSTYQVREGETVESLARNFNCSVYQIRAWNSMPARQQVTPGQKLVIFQLKENYPAKRLEPMKAVASLPVVVPAPVNPISPAANNIAQSACELLQQELYVLYMTRKPESLFDISLKFKIPINELLELNDIPVPNRDLKPGTKVKIRRLEGGSGVTK